MSLLPFFALFGVTLLWFLLPLLPALRELLRPSDIAPLKVVDRSSGDVAYFARNFRQYLEKALPVAAGAGDYSGRMLDGTEFVRVNLRPGAITESERRTYTHLVVLDTPLTLPAAQTFLLEVYARAPLVSGPQSVFRAVYAERDLSLGDGTQVLRWIHATGNLLVGAQSTLHGRVSSDSSVRLGNQVTFERIGAPVISAGVAQEPPPPPPSSPQSWRLPREARRIGDHVRIEGDLEIPEGVLVTANLVVTGRLKLGLGAIVAGSLKAHRDIELGEETQVRGSVVSRTQITLGRFTWIAGPTIAERRIVLGRNAVIGSLGSPATVVAPDVELDQGATVYGQISAMRSAHTL